MEPLKNEYYKKFPDTLYFNDCMILALCQMKQRVLFFPISWREEDQVSNNKLTSFGVSCSSSAASIWPGRGPLWSANGARKSLRITATRS